MNHTIAGERAVALAVGMERYDYGPEMDLPGAADHAVSFARWARRCGVPFKNIWLATSRLTPPVKDPFPQARIVSTTRDGLDAALHQLAAADADLLMLYWCGHGVLDEDRHRVLFTSNATSTSKVCLDVDDIIKLMASGTVLGRQVMLIDACANFVEDMNFATKLVPTHLERGRPKIVDQYVIYSAEQGQIAAYDRSLREARLSKHLLMWLERPERKTLPPDMLALTEHLTARIFADAAPGELVKTPAVLAIQLAGTKDEWIGGTPIAGTSHAVAAARGLTPPQVRRLARAVLECPVPSDPLRLTTLASRLGADVEASRIDEWLASHVEGEIASGRTELMLSALEEAEKEQVLSPVRTARAVWERQKWIAAVLGHPWPPLSLQELRRAHSLANPDGQSTVVSDIDSALDCAAEHSQRGVTAAPVYQLLALLEHQSGSRMDDAWFEMDAAQLAALRANAGQRLDETSKEARLVVDLRVVGAIGPLWPSSISWQVQQSGQWFKREEVPCPPTREGVRAAVQQALDWTLERADASELVIGLIVSRAQQDEVPESWLMQQQIYDPEPLAALYPVVLHSGERLSLKRELHERWSNWLNRASLRVNQDTDVDWLSASTLDSIRMAVLQSQSVVVGLEFKPGPAAAKLKDDRFIAAIAGGAPYIVWLEDEPEDWTETKTSVDQLVAAGVFASTPNRLHQRRREAPARIANGLRLLWDDLVEEAPAKPLRGERTLIDVVVTSPQDGAP